MYEMSEPTFPDEIPLLIPPPLQTLLENDCIEIVQRKKLVKVPANTSIREILTNYYSHCVSSQSSEETNLPLLIEVLDGIKIYFDFTLRDHLLYQEEREQYEYHVTQITSHVTSNGIDSEDNQDKIVSAPPSSFYGAIHLLRLFVKFPTFLSCAKFPPNQVNILHHYFKDILSYLSSELDSLFSSDQYILQ